VAIHHVLVIDDSKTELMFLTDLLQKNGMSVRTAEGAEEAIRVWGLRQGAKDYITKPVNPAELMEKIRALG
jgi:twitching motility two-component system response regulator PilH